MTTLKQELEVGTRIYNAGDMANHEHFGTITGIVRDRWGVHYWVTPDPETEPYEPGERYSVPASNFCDRYLGHSATRFVTAEAYREWRKARMAQFQTAARA